MEYRRVGRTQLEISALSLGTMTFGEQNDEAEAHEQLDMALAAGVNCVDTAEMYPVPPRRETYGATESIIGTWLRKRANRDKVILATKVAGPSRDLTHIRGGDCRLDRRNIEAALDGSLRRLQTDYIDLFQLHWPDRKSNYFGKLGYTHDPDETSMPIAETLAVLNDAVRSGKIRYIGLSNETPWGVMTFLRVAEEAGLPRAVSIQNPYSLLNRTFEIGLAEISCREAVGLLAYSPLGFGVLSGKYLNAARPAGARLTLYERFKRYSNPQAEAATRAYVELARRHNLDPVQMALAYVRSRSFVISVLIGATRPAQLRANLQSATLELDGDVLNGIEDIHQRFPNPSP